MRGDCSALHDVAAELALGIADGEDRARALEHLADCPGCQAELRAMALVADDLLAIAPAMEPPPGFEARVASALEPTVKETRKRPRWLVPLAASLAGAAAAAAIVWFALANDRDLASDYRSTLAVANGEDFGAATLSAPGGERVGYVYGYQGHTSWILGIVYAEVPDGTYELVAEDAAGTESLITPIDISGERGSAGAALDGDFEDVTEVRLLDAQGREVADAALED